MRRRLAGAAGLALLGSLAFSHPPRQAPAPAPLATLAGASVRIAGGAVELDAAGRLRVPDGARIALDGASAELNLVRGGSIHLCGPAQMSLAAGGAQALLLSLQRGALELRYASPVADSLLTPGYRLTTVVPPDQLATVSASVGLEANGDLCVLNRGSALTVERLYDGAERAVINGQGFAFPPAGAPQAVASCPCAAALPPPVVSPPRPPSQGAGPLFPQAPALTVAAGAPPPGPAPAAPAAAAARPVAHRPNVLVRFFRWLFGK
ncbi:MAG TPA: hypothetical protein VMV31_00145 [Terriglobales bacterium]|nr:hypothetical protein [Terriglobales bacterium]